MKLELFNFVDNTLELLATYDDVLNEIGGKIQKTLKDQFVDDESFLNIVYRVKSEKSLREKIIKNNFYIKYKEPENVFGNLSDLIGVRVECRFIKDEEHIYNKIVEFFNVEIDDGYFSCESCPGMKLKLKDKQPQIQKNGFEIYKIDGYFEYGKNRFNFELQIKSMVNVFWGEIDHKILYKNYNYMVTEGFFKEIMASIKDNLSMIDRQLMILYDHVSSLDASAVISAKTQLKILISKIIHDVFSSKVKEELGFVFNFKNTTDIIVDYLYMKSVREKDLSYGENFVDLINNINGISECDLNLEEYLELDKEPDYFDDFTRSIGTSILEVINKDFAWYLFFTIIFQIEKGSNSRSFEEFLYFLRYKYSLVFFDISEKYNYETEEIIWLEEEVLRMISENFCKNCSIDYILGYSLKRLRNNFEEVLSSSTKPLEIEELASLMNEKLKEV